MNKIKRKSWKKNKKNLNPNIQKKEQSVAREKIEPNKTQKSIIIQNSDYPIEDRQSLLNEFVCLECCKVNLVEEDIKRKTLLYENKDIYCIHCEKETTQVCVEDKDLTKCRLEMTREKTEEEEQTLHFLLNQTKEITKEIPKQKRKLNEAVTRRKK